MVNFNDSETNDIYSILTPHWSTYLLVDEAFKRKRKKGLVDLTSGKGFNNSCREEEFQFRIQILLSLKFKGQEV
jgi:hypothetical protein